MDTRQLLSRLCVPFGGSGRERDLTEAVRDSLPGRKTATDAMGNIAVEILPRRSGRPTVMLTAHADRISFLVSEIGADGLLRLSGVGGIDRRTLFGARIAVYAGDGAYAGVICSGESDVPAADAIWADIGYTKEKTPVQIGDRVGFDAPVIGLSDDWVCGGGLDNRAGCAAVIRAAESLPVGLDCGVYVMLAVQEEIGCRGCLAGTENIAPDIAVVVDVSFGDSPDIDAAKTGVCGGGPMIGISPILDAGLFEQSRALARQYEIPFQLEPMGGGTGTDSDRVAAAGGGVRTALFSVPLRNMHTAVETLRLADIDNTARLIAALVNQIGGASHA